MGSCIYCNAEIKKAEQHFILEDKEHIIDSDTGIYSKMCCRCYFKNFNIRRTKDYDFSLCILCDKLLHFLNSNNDGPFYYQFSESLTGECISVCDECWGKNA